MKNTKIELNKTIDFIYSIYKIIFDLLFISISAIPFYLSLFDFYIIIIVLPFCIAPLIHIIIQIINIVDIFKFKDDYIILYPEFKNVVSGWAFDCFKLTVDIPNDGKYEILTKKIFFSTPFDVKGSIQKFTGKKSMIALNLKTKRIVVFPVSNQENNPTQ